MSRIPVDASGLIALARIGRLDLLRLAFGTVHTTRTVFQEVARPEFPDHEALEKARDEAWLLVEEDAKKRPLPPSYGLGPGEASLFAAHRPGDLLLLDDRNARHLCDQRGIPHSGLVGLLTRMAEAGTLAPENAIGILEALAASAFRMTTELYAWSRTRIEGTRRSQRPS